MPSAFLTPASFARPFIILALFVLQFFQAGAIPMLRLQMNGFNGYYDETVVYHQAGASPCFDASYDSYFLAGSNPAPHISQQCNSVLMAINGIDPANQAFSMSIKATTHITGSFTITAADFEELPAGTCVSLKDLYTGALVNILSTPYSFLLQDTTSAARFVLTISSYSMSFISAAVQPDCQSPNGGRFKVTGAGSGPWNCTWKDAMGDTVKTSVGILGSDSLYNISSGSYTVEMASADACASNYSSFAFTIHPVVMPLVSFTSPDSITAGLQVLDPTNESVNCATYAWDFGDSAGSSGSFEPSYNYPVPGLYQVKLRGMSSTGCADSMYRQVVVVGITTHIKKEMSQSVAFADLGGQHYQVTLNGADGLSRDLCISLLSLDSKIIFQQQQAITGGPVQFRLDHVEPGVYLLNLNRNNQLLSSRKVFIQ